MNSSFPRKKKPAPKAVVEFIMATSFKELVNQAVPLDICKGKVVNDDPLLMDLCNPEPEVIQMSVVPKKLTEFTLFEVPKD
jgi:hypothetical protein